MIILFKRFVQYFSIILLIGVFGGGMISVSAQCDSCNQIPSGLETYLEVMTELVDFPPASNETSQGAQVSADRYDRARKVAAQYLQEIVPEIEYVTRGGETQLLEQSQVRSRDYERLLEIDSMILQKLGAFDQVNDGASLNGGSMRTQAEAIDTVLKQTGFMQLARSDDGPNLAQINYVEYLGILRRLNGFMKYIHRDKQWYHYELDQVGKGTLKSDSTKSKNPEKIVEQQMVNIVRQDLVQKGQDYVVRFSQYGTDRPAQIQFTNGYKDLMRFIRNTQADYSCAQGVQSLCSSRKDTAAGSRQNVKDSFERGGDSALDTFLLAIRRLGSLRFGAPREGESLTPGEQRQQQLMNQYRQDDGDDAVRETWRLPVDVQSSEGITMPPSGVAVQGYIKQLIENKNQKAQAKQGLGNGSSSSDTVGDSGGYDSLGSRQARQQYLDEIYQGTFTAQDRKAWQRDSESISRYLVVSDQGSQAASFQQGLSSVLQLQEAYAEQALVTDVSSVTKRLAALSEGVATNAQMRGEKQDIPSANGSIYASAHAVCTNQCRNIDDKLCGALGN